MSSETFRVLEYWRRHDPCYAEGNRVINMAYFDWTRDPSLEVDMPDGTEVR